MFFGSHEKKSFTGVAVMFILVGVVIFVFGALGWLVNATSQTQFLFMPSSKVIGGLIVMALGYIQLELGLIRRK